MKDLSPPHPGYFTADDCDLAAFTALIERTLDAANVPLACDVQKNIPIYDMAALRRMLDDPAQRRALMAEWARGMMSGSGVLVLRGAYADTEVLDEARTVYEAIIAEEKCAGGGGADHFAAGTNDRLWNSLQKLCERAPDVFLRYFGNAPIAAVSEAWLGPNYQMTAQVNLVHPGGAAQSAHRDYHLGFQTAEQCALYPAHVHALSPVMTLQGAIAHCDMTVDSGPTKLLPFSQAYLPGYAAYRLPEFAALFEARCVQLPLAKGDALFFNPALFHAAGENRTTDVERFVNLLQVSSAFGRALENIDRQGMCARLYPVAQGDHGLGAQDLAAALAACAEGYPFPTNLDTDPPKGGLAPESQLAFFERALREGMTPDDFNAGLTVMAAKQRA